MAPTVISQLPPFRTVNSQSSDLFSLDNASTSTTNSNNYGTPFAYFYCPMKQSSDATPLVVSPSSAHNNNNWFIFIVLRILVIYTLLFICPLQSPPNQFQCANQYPIGSVSSNYLSPYLTDTSLTASATALQNAWHVQELTKLLEQLNELNLGSFPSSKLLNQPNNHLQSLPNSAQDLENDSKPGKEYMCHVCFKNDHFIRHCPQVCLQRTFMFWILYFLLIPPTILNMARVKTDRFAWFVFHEFLKWTHTRRKKRTEKTIFNWLCVI